MRGLHGQERAFHQATHPCGQLELNQARELLGAMQSMQLKAIPFMGQERRDI